MSTERPHFKPSICAENEIIFNCSAHNTQMQLEIYFSMHDLQTGVKLDDIVRLQGKKLIPLACYMRVIQNRIKS